MPRPSSLANIEPAVQAKPDDLATAFAEAHGHEWRYVPDHKEWFAWVPDTEDTQRRDKSLWDGGGVWQRDASLRIEDSIRKFCRSRGMVVTPRLVGSIERLARSDQRLARATAGSSGKVIYERPVVGTHLAEHSLRF